MLRSPLARSLPWLLCAVTLAAFSLPSTAQTRRSNTPHGRTGRDEPAETLADTPEARRWSAWGAEHGYAVTSAGGGRVLWIHAAEHTSLAETAKTIAAAVARFDEVCGRPDRDLAPAVLFELADARTFGAALDELAAENPYAAAWLRSVAANPIDFVLEEPVVGALAPFSGEREEWDPQNEIAHRVAHLLLVQRFGHQPHWLTVGLSWTIEQDVRGSIYCFPGRNEFVSVTDHDGWAPELASAYKPKDARAIGIADLCRLERGRFDAGAAARAWGAVRYLAEHERAALPGILSDLHTAWEAASRITQPDGTWVRRGDFDLDPETQRTILERRAGADVWQRMTAAFRDARKLMPAPARSSNRAHGR
jgi:hypothetical protein